MSFNNNQNHPSWVDAIRKGDFASAEADLTAGAAMRVQQQIQETYLQDQLESLVESHGEMGKYIAAPAVARVSERFARGEIKQHQIGQALERSFSQEAHAFRTEMRPGYQRSTYENLPSDVECRDYIAERRAQTERLKEEGRRIPTLLNRNTK